MVACENRWTLKGKREAPSGDGRSKAAQNSPNEIAHVQKRLEFAFRKVCHDHRVHILLQFAVLHSAPIKHARQMIQNRMNDERASLIFVLFHTFFCLVKMINVISREEKKKRTYSTKNTVFQLTCDPRSFTTNSSPSRTPAAAKMALLSSALDSPLSVSFCRST